MPNRQKDVLLETLYSAAFPLISFIVPAHNESQLLGSTLASIHEAAGRCGQHYEIVVVNDSSTDDTGQIAERMRAQVVDVDYKHISATRNAGARAAKGEFLIFVDADTHVEGVLLNAALHTLWRGAVGGGAAVSLRGQPTRWERATVSLLCHAFRWTKIAPGCFLFCTRAAFERVGGFDETLFAAEDVMMSKSLASVGTFTILREKAHTSDRKMRTHGVRSHLKLFRHYFRHGKGILRDRKHLDLWYGERKHS